MPDWQELVRRQLSGLALDAGEKDEVHLELAGHLQELYEFLLTQGMPEQAALTQTWAQIGGWDKLQEQIQIARKKENTMTPRINRLWLPSLVTLLLAMMMLPILERLGLNPQFLFLRGPHGHTYVFTVYTVWLMVLPFVGALGAYLSGRAGGTRPAIIVSGIFPALAFFVVLLLVLPFMGFLEHGLEANARSVFHSWTSEPLGRLGVLAGWALVPGVCLLIGVEAYVLLSRRLAQRSIASH
ncbi:MAG TPA: hypothetical protein VNB49_12590 [Candidatus Dormibacteraeota bacterium]|nr:hypothetical protein [Candidatus Dormibacteraeota bacterium]